MKVLFRNASVYESGVVRKQDMLLTDTSLFAFTGATIPSDATVIDNTVILPGFCDVHVHLREPGFSYKETIKSGTMAAAHGGYTTVLSMPNLMPTPDSKENLEAQLEIIRRDAVVRVLPFGTITVGEFGLELADMEGMADDVVGYSDDGKGVQDIEMMKRAMRLAKELGKPISAHCEENSLLHGGYIHDGEYARANGHRGISSASEYVPIARDIELVRECGVDYHVCHISTKESVDIIRRAKGEGVNVSCETGPHYLLLDDSYLSEDARFKMNPPLRSPSDREALVDGLIDGTIDMIATDHAPHSAEEKARGLENSPMGVVGLESCFPLMYTYFVKEGLISLERLVELMAIRPRERFNIAEDMGITIFKVDEEYEINPEDFLSLGRSTPFEGVRVFGRCLFTMLGDGTIAYADEIINK